MAKSVHYKYPEMKRFLDDAFVRFGFSGEEAAQITDVLLLSDLYGIASHGLQRLVRYHKCIKNGMIKVGAQPEVVFETPVSAVIDAHDGMGQLVAVKAMKMAIEKAKKTGIAIVSVRNSNHYGIAGYYAKMACDEGLIGMSVTNTTALMVPTFGKKAMLGSNPIAVSMPAEPYPFFFDSSTTVVTRGKLEMYNKLGKNMPIGWAVDENGIATEEAPRVLRNIDDKAGGGILPLGGHTEQLGSHKGYGYAMLCEIFSSIISLGKTSNHTYENGKCEVCHGFAAIDPNIFGNAEEIREYLSNFLRELREAPKADGQARIYTHGEKEIEAYRDRMEYGWEVNINTVLEMKNLCDDLGMDYKEYLGDVDFSDANKNMYEQRIGGIKV